MAYPFTKLKTYAEVKNILSEQGVKVGIGEGQIESPDGIHIVDVLTRSNNGKVLLVAISYSNDDLISHHVVRSICARLEMNPDVFDLDLG
jgi:hypothetical protein